MEAPYSPRRGLDSMKRHQDLYKKTPDWKRKYKGMILFFYLMMSGNISGMFQEALRYRFERTVVYGQFETLPAGTTGYLINYQKFQAFPWAV